MLPLRGFRLNRKILGAFLKMKDTSGQRDYLVCNKLFSRQYSFENKLFLNGEWCNSSNGSSFSVYNPATEEEITQVPDVSDEQVLQNIKDSKLAFSKWKKTTGLERSRILRRWYDLCKEKSDELANLVVLENGKPISDARAEVTYANNYIEWFAEEARRIYGDIVPTSASSKRFLILKQPQGVCALITPWNFPLAMITRKAGAALAAGCTVLIKPAEDTPLSALSIAKLAQEAGVPDGVLNVLTCSRTRSSAVGKLLCESRDVRHVSFTGSTAVGKILLAQCASTVKRVTLENGGNAPVIVFSSSNLDTAVRGVLASKFRCSGQTCVCANRIYVQASIYDSFVEKLSLAMASDLFIGNGASEWVTQGPLVNATAVKKVSDLVESARQEGARVIAHNLPDSNGKGYFYPPTLLLDVKPSMECIRNEIFGPIAPILKFEDEDEVIKIANDIDLGLASYIYSQDPAQIWRVTEALECGIVGVNEGLLSAVEAPFSGHKESGLGLEGSKYGTDMFLDTKYVCWGDLTEN